MKHLRFGQRAGWLYVHERSTSPIAARFELVESGIMAGMIFKLDRFNGRIWQNSINTDGTSGWEEMPVEHHFQKPIPIRPF